MGAKGNYPKNLLIKINKVSFEELFCIKNWFLHWEYPIIASG
jgi:hypothetical protein